MPPQEVSEFPTINYDVKNRRNKLTLRRFVTFGGRLALAGIAIVGCSSADTSHSGSANNSSKSTNSIFVDNGVGPAVLLDGSHHMEIQQFGAQVFADYVHASGVGKVALKIGDQVDVDCFATGPLDAAPSAQGKWYHIQSPADFAGYYAAANTFENGDTSGPVSEQPAIDPAVPACP